MKKIGLLLSAVLLVTIGVLAWARVAVAAEPIYPVMNTSEYPPDGIYFRNSPNWDDAIRVTGHGVFAGDRVRLKCWEYGTNVPRRDGSSNTVWYIADNVTRPTSPLGANTGWINAHFVNDGTGPNQVASGVIRCGSTPPPSATPVAGFFSPFKKGGIGADGRVEDLRDQTGIKPVYSNDWYSCTANSDRPYNAAKNLLKAGQYYDRLGGWSLGRFAVPQELQGMKRNDPAARKKVNYILQIDPGPYSDLSGCDRTVRAGDTYASWLKDVPNARLIVLSGTLTQKQDSKGIQEIWFNPIRNQAAGTNIRSRVMVCNYKMDHYQIYHAGQYWFKHRIGSTCPVLNFEGKYWKPTARWNP
jgi:hypothetical protein